MTTPSLWYYGPGALLVGALSYLLVRLNERIEKRQSRWPRAVLIGGATIVALIAVLLPPAIAAPLAIAIAGTIPLAWSDLHTRMLWDDATMLTVLATGVTDVICGIAAQALEAALLAAGILMIHYLCSAISIRVSAPTDDQTFTIFRIGRTSLILGDSRIGIADVRMSVILGFALAPVAIYWPVVALVAAMAIWAIWHLLRRERDVPLGPIFLSALVFGGVAAPLNALWSSQ